MQRLTYFLRWANILLIFLMLFAYLSPFVSPVTCWPLSFLGLFYPWILLGNLLFVAGWVLAGKRYFLFSLACVLLGWNHLTSLVGLRTGDAMAPSPETTLTVMSYNIHQLRDTRKNNEHFEEAPFVDMLNATGVEILCVQELPPTSRTWTMRLADKIVAETNLRYRYIGEKGGLAVFSAYPLSHSQTIYSNPVNGYQYTDVQRPGGTIRLYNLHLHSNAVSDLADRVATDGNLQERETWLDIKGMLSRYKRSTQRRARQAEALAAHIDQTNLPVVLCGDFNDIPQSYTYHLLNHRLQDTFKKKGRGLATTYAGKIPGLRIDYILASPHVRVHRFRTGARSFSDHRPVWSELEIPTR